LYRGKTPLHAAAWNGQAEVVEKLIAAGAKVDATNGAGRGGTGTGGCWCRLIGGIR
jgi:ankyrin repeat protein